MFVSSSACLLLLLTLPFGVFCCFQLTSFRSTVLPSIAPCTKPWWNAESHRFLILDLPTVPMLLVVSSKQLSIVRQSCRVER
ncbi:uncharacterized protein B0T23DRAFT_371961 [Neurospora hispaniola]|uniref:Secreted protein n=1 Tax=Neurospora hispaniola TaxID=588809 RepID=A0AAJ0MWE5_9PEZI|nr:hypothetical protein B0T23DRAFT_371961 [Neurospora hispaniola]